LAATFFTERFLAPAFFAACFLIFFFSAFFGIIKMALNIL